MSNFSKTNGSLCQICWVRYCCSTLQNELSNLPKQPGSYLMAINLLLISMKIHVLPLLTKKVQCNLNLVTLNLVTTCDLVIIFQRPFFNLLHKIIKFSDIMWFSDRLHCISHNVPEYHYSLEILLDRALKLSICCCWLGNYARRTRQHAYALYLYVIVSRAKDAKQT